MRTQFNIMNHTVIAAGSNIDPGVNIEKAIAIIQKSHVLHKKTAFVETKPLLYADQPDFLNGSLLVETELQLDELKEWLKSVEKELGRVPTENKYGPRTIDLDVIVWNGKVVCSDFYDRDFVKTSVLELLPGLKF